jgi:hypothetical protein
VDLTEDLMPVFTIKAKDALGLIIIRQYKYMCEISNLPEQAEQVELAIKEFEAWEQIIQKR